MRLPNFSSWFLLPDRKTRAGKAYEIAWTMVAVVFVAGAIKFAQLAMQSTGLTFTRLFQWSAASTENATLVTWAAIAAGILAYVARQFRQKWFGIVEIGAGALTAFVILREEREVVVQCCAVIAAVFVVVRGAGNAWEGIRAEVAAEAKKRSPRAVSPIARFSVARRARRARKAARAHRIPLPTRTPWGSPPRFSATLRVSRTAHSHDGGVTAVWRGWAIGWCRHGGQWRCTGWGVPLRWFWRRCTRLAAGPHDVAASTNLWMSTCSSSCVNERRADPTRSLDHVSDPRSLELLARGQQ